ncbi:MAG: hypothetical protein HY317_02780 [Acidobacteria bacterium]|nr:hypothetical protein [Acidobacteriota bacterium]
MARGFESKSVADQQESAQQTRRRAHKADEADDPAVRLRRKRLELARTDVLHQLEHARADAHKEMLKRALAALDKDLKDLP